MLSLFCKLMFVLFIVSLVNISLILGQLVGYSTSENHNEAINKQLNTKRKDQCARIFVFLVAASVVMSQCDKNCSPFLIYMLHIVTIALV